MTSLIDVLDTRELHNKKQQFNKYLFETPCGELSFLKQLISKYYMIYTLFQKWKMKLHILNIR